jgi:predicted KAP-like P-loop ATPase
VATHPHQAEYLRADAPIERRSEDRLGRASLAEAIADQVIHGPAGHGLVIGVTGRWGSGKTSVLRMVEETVHERSSTTIVHFNPWLFSSSQELVSRFLQELGTQLRNEGQRQRGGDRLTVAGDRLLTYSEVLEPLGWIPIVGSWLSRAGRASKTVKQLRDARRNQPSVEAQRESVRTVLAGLEQRVLVVIDDMDRIEAEQIRDMVRLVKLVGDFPNTTYLLSYDRGPVEAALGETPEDGRAYLEKVVQVVHDLPEPPESALVGVLLEELQTIVDGIDHGPFRLEDWQNMFPDGLRPFFGSVRDVRRYLNAVPVTLRVIGGEVAVVDVLALEALRLFAPDAYARLAAEVGLLTGEERASTYGSQEEERDRARVQAVVHAAGEFAEATKAILQRLFPNVAHFVGGSRVGGGEQAARRELRVSSPDILRTYLGRALPEGVVSGVFVSQMVDALTDRQRLETLLGGLDSETLERAIERLEDYEHDYDPAAVEPAISAVLNQLPKLREGRRGMMDFGADLVVTRVVLRLLRRIDDEDKRLALVERVLPEVTQLTGRLELIDLAGHRANVGHRLIPAEAATRLYDDLKAATISASPKLLAEERDLGHLFARLVEADEEQGARQVRDACSDDRVMLRLLRSALGERRRQMIGDYAVRTVPSLPWELFEVWFGEAALRERVEQLSRRVDKDTLPDRTRAALEAAEQSAAGELTNNEDF